MPVYLGLGIGQRLASELPRVSWLCTAPVVGAPTYPIALDIAESARTASQSELVSAACAALAPMWEELEQYGLTGRAARGPQWHNAGTGEGGGEDRFLYGALADVVASLGAGFGVLLRHPERYEPASMVFAVRLIGLARLHGLHVAVEAPTHLIQDPQFRECLRDAIVLEGYRGPNRNPDPNDRGTQLLALAPHGIPLHLLPTLGVDRITSAVESIGVAGQAWVSLGPSARRYVTARLPPAVIRELHTQLFDAWPPTGWGYLRRAGHAIGSKNQARLLIQHTPYLHGMQTIGREFLYRHFVALSESIDEPHSPHAVPALTGAARLASELGAEPALHVARRYYRRALDYCNDPATQATISHEIAITHARQHKPDDLARARKWYKYAYRFLRRVPPGEQRVRLEIMLANGLALVEYHGGNNEKALELEQVARSIADGAAEYYPQLSCWASGLLNLNTAKLLEKRFEDIQGAMNLLSDNLSSGQYLVREVSSVELARLHFDRSEYDAVIDTLAPILDQRLPAAFDQARELFARAMLTISLLALERPEQARLQLGRLSYLCRAVESPEAARLLTAICRGCETP